MAACLQILPSLGPWLLPEASTAQILWIAGFLLLGSETQLKVVSPLVTLMSLDSLWAQLFSEMDSHHGGTHRKELPKDKKSPQLQKNKLRRPTLKTCVLSVDSNEGRDIEQAFHPDLCHLFTPGHEPKAVCLVLASLP